MTNSITLSAPAKVNLFLKVLKKRKDGYHDIVTIFERISLADKITISKIPHGIELDSDKFITAKPEDNLIYKAAEMILGCRRAKKGLKGVNKGVKIRVTKRIPIAAGLGGGSSDAASTLIGINRLFGLKLTQKELMSMGSKLGADVPFFILDTPFAIGTGRGDQLEELKRKTPLWHVIIYPGFQLATKDVYEAFDLLTTNDSDVKIQPAYNDLERAAIFKKRILGYIIERLASSGDTTAIISGSGPSVFCLCRTRKEAIATRKKLFRNTPAGIRKSWQVFIA